MGVPKGRANVFSIGDIVAKKWTVYGHKLPKVYKNMFTFVESCLLTKIQIGK